MITEARRKAMKKYRTNNQDKIKKLRLAYYESCDKEYIKKYREDWNRKNKDKVAEHRERAYIKVRVQRVKNGQSKDATGTGPKAVDLVTASDNYLIRRILRNKKYRDIPICEITKEIIELKRIELLAKRIKKECILQEASYE
jgi:hypothetical protein